MCEMDNLEEGKMKEAWRKGEKKGMEEDSLISFKNGSNTNS